MRSNRQARRNRPACFALEALEERAVPSGNPPVAHAGGPYTVPEGSAVALSAELSSDPEGDALTYSWDTNNDGSFGDLTGVAPILPRSFLTWDGRAIRTIHVEVSDGTSSSVASATLTVLNIPPQVVIVPTFGPNGLTVRAAASDPSPTDTEVGFSYLWSVTLNGAGPGIYSSPELFFTAPGTYAFTVQVTDKDGGAGTASATLTLDGPPARLLAVGAGAGAASHVRVFDSTGVARHDLFPFGGFAGGACVATGRVTGGAAEDIVVGAGPGAPGGHVKVFSGATGEELRSFFAFEGFGGGVSVGTADIDGDGFADIIVGAGPGAPGGHVKVFDGRTGAELRSFFAFEGFAGGVTVAGGEAGRGWDELVVGAGAGAPGGHVKVFDGATGALLRSFFAFDAGFAGGVNVAAGDLNRDGFLDVIVGADGSAPHVAAFDGASGGLAASFFTFPGFSGGSRVGAADLDGNGADDILAGAGPGGSPHVRAFAGLTQAELLNFLAFDPTFQGGVFVG